MLTRKSKKRRNVHSHLTILILLPQSTPITSRPVGMARCFPNTSTLLCTTRKTYCILNNSAVKFPMQIRPKKDLTRVGYSASLYFPDPTSRHQHRQAEQQQSVWKWGWSLPAPKCSKHLLGAGWKVRLSGPLEVQDQNVHCNRSQGACVHPNF